MVGRVGTPPLHKKGATEGFGSTQEFLGWSHGDV